MQRQSGQDNRLSHGLPMSKKIIIIMLFYKEKTWFTECLSLTSGLCVKMCPMLPNVLVVSCLVSPATMARCSSSKMSRPFEQSHISSVSWQFLGGIEPISLVYPARPAACWRWWQQQHPPHQPGGRGAWPQHSFSHLVPDTYKDHFLCRCCGWFHQAINAAGRCSRHASCGRSGNIVCPDQQF